jgi:hypothetical protein
MKISEIVIWVAEQRKLGLTTKQIEEKFDKLIKSLNIK